jgi:hypothetical protein
LSLEATPSAFAAMYRGHVEERLQTRPRRVALKSSGQKQHLKMRSRDARRDDQDTIRLVATFRGDTGN